MKETGKIFLSVDGKLTSASANHIANIAKESIVLAEREMEGICFYQTEVGLLATDTNRLLNGGYNEDVLPEIEKTLKRVAECNSLIAWLREGIKAKKEMEAEVNDYDVTDYCKVNGIDMPKSPVSPKLVTTEEVVATLDIKVRNRIIMLMTKASVLGGAIHKGGFLSKARLDLINVIREPNKLEGEGQNAIVRKFTPTCNVEAVNGLFFKLQAKHRSVQAELNGLLHNVENMVNATNMDRTMEYNNALAVYNEEMKKLRAETDVWKRQCLSEVEKLKIVIPNDLLETYNAISAIK